MACGLPAVATAVGGVPEVFAEGGALLVPPDQPEKLADALHIVMTDPDVRTRLGREGQLSFQKNFTWDAVRTKYLYALASLAA
jgi:glycosyltransferase involved in cell wall biosynthesis